MSDILKRFAEDARRLHVAQKLPPPPEPVPYDKARLVAEDFDRLLTLSGLSRTDVARRMGKGYSGATISTWSKAAIDEEHFERFKGDFDKITRGINSWMETFVREHTAPKTNDFVDIHVAKNMMAVIHAAMTHRAMGVICSDSGRGKTMTFKAAAQTYPGTIYLRIIASTRTPQGLAQQLRHSMQLGGSKTLRDIQFRLIDTLTGSSRLMLIDEGHQLQPAALEFLRDLHDDCGIPIVLGGTREIEDHVSDPSIFFGQLESRIVARYDVNQHVRKHSTDHDPARMIHTPEELQRIFANDQIRFTGDGLSALTRIANLEGFGGLRLAKQVAVAAASIAKDIAIDGKLVLKVLRELHGRARAIDRIERALDNSKLKIA